MTRAECCICKQVKTECIYACRPDLGITGHACQQCFSKMPMPREIASDASLPREEDRH